MCRHEPVCPTADAPDRDAAQVIIRNWSDGWAQLCNGVYLFEDTGELLPDGSIIPPCRPAGAVRVAA